MASEERLHELEIRLAFVDDSVAALTVADAELAQRLLAIERLLVDMRSELRSLRSAASDSFHDEPPPPHY